MSREKVEKIEGGIDAYSGIGVKAEKFLRELSMQDLSYFISCRIKFEEIIKDENDPRGHNHNLLCAAYLLSLKKLGISEDSNNQAISFVTKSIRDQISLLGIAEKYLETTILHIVQTLVRETVIDILDEELSEGERISKKQRIMETKRNQTKYVKSLEEKRVNRVAIKEIIKNDIDEFLSSIREDADPKLIEIVRLLRSVMPEHIVKMIEDGYTPEVRRQTMLY